MKKKILTFITAFSITAGALPFSCNAYEREIDYSLWYKFIKYDLCITDYDALTDEQKELCRFIFETERSSDEVIVCERARRTLAGDENLGERITLEQLETAYGIWDNYAARKLGRQSYIHCVPDIRHLDSWNTYNEYWLDDEGTSYVCFKSEDGTEKDNFEVFDEYSYTIEPQAMPSYKTPVPAVQIMNPDTFDHIYRNWLKTVSNPSETFDTEEIRSYYSGSPQKHNKIAAVITLTAALILRVYSVNSVLKVFFSLQ